MSKMNCLTGIFTICVSSLLLFAINADLSPEENNGEHISKLIFEFITHYKRLKFGIVFTCLRGVDERILPFNDVAKRLMHGNVSFRAISIDNYDEQDCSSFGKYAQIMRGLIAHQQFVLLDMDCAGANEVLFEASRYELFNASFHWLIIDKKASPTNDDDGDGVQDGTGSDRLQRGQWRNCRRRPWQVPPLFGNAAAGNASSCSDDGDGDEDTLDRLATMNISINAEITLVRESGLASGHEDRQRKVYALFDIWNPGFISGGQLNVTAMGNYVVDAAATAAGPGRLTVWFHQSTVVRRRDMRGLKLKIMTVVTQRPRVPFEVYLATPVDTHLDSVHRYNFGLMSYIRDYFNFSFIMRRTKSWGYLRNGTFDGMIGALSRREVDLGGSPMFFRQERHRVVSYTTRSFIERPCFIFRHPKRQNTMRNPFLLPFEAIIWYLMMFCGTLLVVVLFTSYQFEESGFVVRRADSAAKSSKIHTNKFDGPLKIEADDESYYGDSFHFNRSFRPPPTLAALEGLAPKRQPGTKENVLFNDTNKNNDDNDDPNGCQQLGLRQWRKLLSRRHLRASQHQQQRKSLHSNNNNDDNTTTNSSTTTLQADSMKRAPNVLQPAVHSVLPPGVEHNGGDDATWRSSNYKVEKLSKSILLFLGGVCQQGLSEIPRLPSGRCTSLFILVFGYLMFQYYSASIVGSLLMAPPKTIRSLRHLIDSRLTLGIEDIPYSRDYFVRTTDADSLELFHTRISFYDQKSGQNESHFLNAADGLHLTRKGGYAFHVAISAAYKIIRETFTELEICELTEIDMFPRSSQWMVAIVQKNSPYRDVITYGLRRLNEAGIMDRQRRVWQEPKPKCVRKIAPSDLIVGLDTVYSAFILLVAGSLLSVGLLLIEILRHRLDRVVRWGQRRRWDQRQWQQPRTRPGNLPQDHGWVYPYVD